MDWGEIAKTSTYNSLGQLHLTERIAFLGIVGGQLRAPMKKPRTSQQYGFGMFKGPLMGPLLYREQPGSRTADVNIVKHAGKSFSNLVGENQIWIVIYTF